MRAQNYAAVQLPLIGMWVSRYRADDQPVRPIELDRQLSGHPSAVFDLDALRYDGMPRRGVLGDQGRVAGSAARFTAWRNPAKLTAAVSPSSVLKVIECWLRVRPSNTAVGRT